MQCLDVLLLFVLGRDELHVWLHQSGTNGLCIVAVLLLMLEEWFNILRCDHFDLVTQSLKLTLSPERASASFDANAACWDVGQF